MDREAANNLAAAARLRGLHADTTYRIENFHSEGVVGVEAAFVVCDRKSRPLAQVLASIAYIVKQRALNILLKGPAKTLPNEPVHELGVVAGIAYIRRCFDDGKPS